MLQVHTGTGLRKIQSPMVVQVQGSSRKVGMYLDVTNLGYVLSGGVENKWYYSRAWNYMHCYLNMSNGNIVWHKLAHNYSDYDSQLYYNQGWALTAGVIPVFDLVANAKIVSGEGSFEAPYRIASGD